MTASSKLGSIWPERRFSTNDRAADFRGVDVGSSSVRSSFGAFAISLKSLHILTWYVHLDQGHHNQAKHAKPAPSLPLVWNRCARKLSPVYPQRRGGWLFAVAGALANCRLAAKLDPILSLHSLVVL